MLHNAENLIANAWRESRLRSRAKFIGILFDASKRETSVRVKSLKTLPAAIRRFLLLKAI